MRDSFNDDLDDFDEAIELDDFREANVDMDEEDYFDTQLEAEDIRSEGSIEDLKSTPREMALFQRHGPEIKAKKKALEDLYRRFNGLRKDIKFNIKKLEREFSSLSNKKQIKKRKEQINRLKDQKKKTGSRLSELRQAITLLSNPKTAVRERNASLLGSDKTSLKMGEKVVVSNNQIEKWESLLASIQSKNYDIYPEFQISKTPEQTSKQAASFEDSHPIISESSSSSVAKPFLERYANVAKPNKS